MYQMESLAIFLAKMHKSKKKIELFPAELDTVKNAKEVYESIIPRNGMHGAIFYGTGGFVVDHWIRVYGSGKLNAVKRNQLIQKSAKEIEVEFPWVAIADDVFGGIFFIQNERVHYLMPDTLDITNTGYTYDEFIDWCLLQDTDLFYQNYRSNGWENIVQEIDTEQGLSSDPFLCMASLVRSFTIVPIAKVIGLTLELYKEFSDTSDEKQTEAISTDSKPKVSENNTSTDNIDS